MKDKIVTMEDAQGFLAEYTAKYGKTDPGLMRPYIGKDGNAYVIVHKGGKRDDPKNYHSVPVQNAALRYDEWRTLDEAVVMVAEERLVGFDDLREFGLVRPLANAMGTTVLTWEEMSDAMTAHVSIDPVRRGQDDVVDFQAAHIPIPIVHSDFTLGERLLTESRNRGSGLDTLNAERATRKVTEVLEDMLFGSTATLVYGGGTIQSYISHPDINNVSLVIDWDGSNITPALIRADVLAMKQSAIDAKYYGPYVLYIPVAYETVLDEDYDVSGQSLKTIRQRILDIEKIQKIVIVDRLPANNVLLVTMNRNVVDLIDGMPIQNVQWNTEGGFIHNFKVMTIQVPRVKSDYNNNSGIVLLS